MIGKLSDNIISPLGYTSSANYAAVKAGRSALRRYEDYMDIPEPFTASLLDKREVAEEFSRLMPPEAYTQFEQMVILSVYKALADAEVDVRSERVVFILSTTKGNVELLDSRSATFPGQREYLGVSAAKIASYFGFVNKPVVVSNACISGLSAQIAAMRAIESGQYDTAIVSGADVQSRFIISGFQSFKALAPEACRPFDKNRQGLNLGEAAATIIYSKDPAEWQAVRGAVRNDANHISGPSRTGEGSFRALRAVLQGESFDEIAFVNVHGTSTLYNDEMESLALGRAGLSAVPVNSLKGFYGHTMGAAGILETILSMHAVDDHTVLATRGYEECGTSNPLNIANQNRATDKRAFVKLLSGFGGCNASMLFKRR